MISAVTGTTSTNGTTGTSSTTKTTTAPNDQMGKDAFLKLLVAQLKYQNPLSPMDGTEFIAQTAQLTMTEKLEELATLQTAAVAEGNKRSAAELVGRTITYDNGTNVVEGKVSSALMNAGAPVLLIGKVEVPLGKVLEVRSGATAGTTAINAAMPNTATPATATAGTATPATSTPATATTGTATTGTGTTAPTSTAAASPAASDTATGTTGTTGTTAAGSTTTTTTTTTSS